MNSITWLMAANICVWLGLGAYVAFLARTQQKLRQRLQLREKMDDN